MARERRKKAPEKKTEKKSTTKKKQSTKEPKRTARKEVDSHLSFLLSFIHRRLILALVYNSLVFYRNNIFK